MRYRHHHVARPRLKARLSIGPVDDPAEREAERVADQVMRMPVHMLQRSLVSIQRCSDSANSTNVGCSCPACLQAVHAEMLSRKASGTRVSEVTPEVETSITAMRGSGQPLAPEARAFMEPRFGHDFSTVRVHTDTRAARTAADVGALAFTVGSDIAFGAGQYQPRTEAGKRLIAHELTHVVQKGTGQALAALQRQVIELPEVQIVGDPQFYQRALRRNQYWSIHTSIPGWPYTNELRELWNRGDVDTFADKVAEFQVAVMHSSLAEADGILGPRTAAAVTGQLTAGASNGPTEDQATSSIDAGAPSAEEQLGGPTTAQQAALGPAPAELMAAARARPWPIHSAVYEEEMLAGGVGIDGLAQTWDGFLNQMAEINFLGRPVVGHTAFLRRLDIAQRWLMSRHPGIAAKRIQVGRPGQDSQWRASSRKASPHAFGMAVDINAGENPWLNNPDARYRDRNTFYAWIIWRAVWLMGSAMPITPAESHRRAGSRSSQRDRNTPQSTEEIWTYFNDANRATLAYLQLAGNRTAVAERLRNLGPRPSQLDPSGSSAENIGAYLPAAIPIDRLALGSTALDDWMRVIDHDKAHWPNRESDGTIKGFFNLDKELVIALRDHGGLQWGACDLGRTQSGDMMHFALDPPQFFVFRDKVRKRIKASSGE